MTRAAPQRLADDCFTLPPGLNWTPVDDALQALERRMRPKLLGDLSRHLTYELPQP